MSYTNDRKKPKTKIDPVDPEGFTDAEQARRKELYDAFITDFPHLNAVSLQGKLQALLDLNLTLDRVRMRLIKDPDALAAEETLSKLTKQLVDMEKALNIHPDQIAKQQKDREGGSVGEAVKRFDDDEQTPEELRQRWFVEELLVLYQMYHRPSPRPDSGGYQLDEVGLFGATRCATCHCSKCKTRNFRGLSVEEIETYLVEQGALTHVGNVEVQPIAAPNASDETAPGTGAGSEEHLPDDHSGEAMA